MLTSNELFGETLRFKNLKRDDRSSKNEPKLSKTRLYSGCHVRTGSARLSASFPAGRETRGRSTSACRASRYVPRRRSSKGRSGASTS